MTIDDGPMGRSGNNCGGVPFRMMSAMHRMSLSTPADVPTIQVMNFIRAWRRRIRCAIKTRGLHELDLASRRCYFCKRPWSELVVSPAPRSDNKDAGSEPVAHAS